MGTDGPGKAKQAVFLGVCTLANIVNMGLCVGTTVAESLLSKN